MTLIIDYSIPFSSYVDLKYSKTDSYFGVKLKFQYLNAGIEGTNWKSNSTPINGDVTSLTTLILLEHLNNNDKWNFGYNFGLGYTSQKLRQNLSLFDQTVSSGYMSINASVILSKKINERLALQIEPTLLWTDPC